MAFGSSCVTGMVSCSISGGAGEDSPAPLGLFRAIAQWILETCPRSGATDLEPTARLRKRMSLAIAKPASELAALADPALGS